MNVWMISITPITQISAHGMKPPPEIWEDLIFFTVAKLGAGEK